MTSRVEKWTPTMGRLVKNKDEWAGTARLPACFLCAYAEFELFTNDGTKATWDT